MSTTLPFAETNCFESIGTDNNAINPHRRSYSLSHDDYVNRPPAVLHFPPPPPRIGNLASVWLRDWMEQKESKQDKHKLFDKTISSNLTSASLASSTSSSSIVDNNNTEGNHCQQNSFKKMIKSPRMSFRAPLLSLDHYLPDEPPMIQQTPRPLAPLPIEVLNKINSWQTQSTTQSSDVRKSSAPLPLTPMTTATSNSSSSSPPPTPLLSTNTSISMPSTPLVQSRCLNIKTTSRTSAVHDYVTYETKRQSLNEQRLAELERKEREVFKILDELTKRDNKILNCVSLNNNGETCLNTLSMPRLGRDSQAAMMMATTGPPPCHTMFTPKKAQSILRLQRKPLPWPTEEVKRNSVVYLRRGDLPGVATVSSSSSFSSPVVTVVSASLSPSIASPSSHAQTSSSSSSFPFSSTSVVCFSPPTSPPPVVHHNSSTSLHFTPSVQQSKQQQQHHPHITLVRSKPTVLSSLHE